MPKPSNRIVVLKFLTASIVALLLAIGLCSYGGGFDTHVTQLQIAATYAGTLLALISFVTFLFACNEVGKKNRKRWPR